MTQNWLLWLNTTEYFNCGSWSNCSDIWFWDMDIHRFNCSRVRGTVKSDVCSLALTCSSWSRWAVDRPVMISSHGYPSLLTSLRTSVSVAMLWLPSTSLYHNPHWEPRTPPCSLPWLTPTPWRGDITASLTCTLWAATALPFLPNSVRHRMSAGLLALWKQASLLFARSPNIKGIPLVPLWPQPLYSGLALQEQQCRTLTPQLWSLPLADSPFSLR